MQHAFAEAEERCSRFDGRAASARALVRKLREIVAQIHALHQTAPPSTLLEPLATKVLPALGDTQQDRNLARFVFLLLGIGVEALPQPSVVDDKETTEKSNALEIVKTLEHALVNQELGLNSPEWRRAAALRLFARLAKAKARIVAGSAHATVNASSALRGPIVAAAVNKALAHPSQELSASQSSSSSSSSSRRFNKLLGRGSSSSNADLNADGSSGNSSSLGGTSNSGRGPDVDFASIGAGPGDEKQDTLAAFPDVSEPQKRRSFLTSKRRRSSTRSTGSSGSDREGTPTLPMKSGSQSLASATFAVLRALPSGHADLDAAVGVLASGDEQNGAIACAFLAHRARLDPVAVAARLFAHIPHCKQPSATELVCLHAASCRVRWAELCGIIASSGKVADGMTQTFYVSLALLARDRGPRRIRLAAISALARCPWRFCNTLSLPAYPATASEEAVLDCVVRELLDTFVNRPSQAARFCACKALCALARSRVIHVAAFGPSMLETISLQVLWPHLIALCRTTSSVALQLEATKAMIWLANDKVSRSDAGGSSGRQIKALTTGFAKDAIGEVLQALEARVHYDPGLAWLLLDLAYSRYSNNPEGMGINSLFEVWRSCLERADGPVTHAVLRDLLALLDRPAIAGSYAALFGFLNEHIALFAKLQISDMPTQHRNDDDMNNLNGLEDLDDTSRPAFLNFISGPIGNIAHRLVRSAFFDASIKVQQICAHALCRLAVLCPEEKHKDLENLLRYLARQQGHFASSLGLLQTTLALLHAPPGIPEQHISALIDATLQISR